MFCKYYTAECVTKTIWLIIAHLKSHDNVAFHRTMDKSSSRMEFFVPEGQNETFKEFMAAYKSAGFILDYREEPNRMELEEQQ